MTEVEQKAEMSIERPEEDKAMATEVKKASPTLEKTSKKDKKSKKYLLSLTSNELSREKKSKRNRSRSHSDSESTDESKSRDRSRSRSHRKKKSKKHKKHHRRDDAADSESYSRSRSRDRSTRRKKNLALPSVTEELIAMTGEEEEIIIGVTVTEIMIMREGITMNQKEQGMRKMEEGQGRGHLILC